MYDRYLRRFLGAGLAWCCLGWGALHSVQVNAADGYRASVSGNETRYTGQAMNARFNSKFVWEIGPDGKINATSTGSLGTGGGRSIPLGAKSVIPNGAAAAAIKAGLRAAPFLGTGIALFELARELGFDVTKSGGDVVVTKAPDGSCTEAPCYGWRITNPAYGTSVYSSANAMCAAVAPQVGIGAGAVCNGTSAPVSGYVTCYLSSPSYGAYNYGSCGYQVSVPPADFVLPSTVDELADKIASESGWPTGSKVADALRDSIDLGAGLLMPDPVITGPSTSAGPVTTTTNNTTGDVTVSTTTYGHTYNDNRVTTTSTVVTTVNGTPTQTTQEEAKDPETDECQKNPDSVACQALDTPSDQVPKRTVDVAFSAEDLGLGGGSCPAAVTFDVATGHYEIAFTKWCDALTTWVRPLVIALATLMAFMIAWPRSES